MSTIRFFSSEDMAVFVQSEAWCQEEEENVFISPQKIHNNDSRNNGGYAMGYDM